MRRGRGVDKTRSKRTCCCRKCARWWIERRVESQPYPGALESEAIQDQVQGVHQNPTAAVLAKGSRWQWLRLHSQYLSNLLFLLQLHQAGSWFSNQKKDFDRVGMYKRTKLHHQAWQMACLNNLYDNFCRSEGINDHPCDLMRHCRDRVPSWTADLLQVQNSGPFYHDQQIYLLQMFHISGVLQLPSSRPPMSICQKKIGDPLGKSLHHYAPQSFGEDQAEIWAASLLS